MTKYYEWLIKNLRNTNKIHYHRWEDDNTTYIQGVYDEETKQGIEQVFTLQKEYEIDKTEEIKEDLRKYQE